VVLIEYDDYKGNKLIRLRRDEQDQYAFAFGRKKARLILEAIEEIKKFVEDEEHEKHKVNISMPEDKKVRDKRKTSRRTKQKKD
jgi:hypothetical protein